METREREFNFYITLEPHHDIARCFHPEVSRAGSSIDNVVHQRDAIHCYGELLSYGRATGTQASLQQVTADWQQGQLQPERLNGRFLLVIYDKLAAEWTFITDLYGSFHAYIVWQNGRVQAVGSDLAMLAKSASNGSLDWEAITTFFAFGFFLDDRTYFDDVRILLPASLYRLSTNGVLRERRRYRYWEHRVEHDRSYDDTADEYHLLLQQAVRRCTTEGQVLLPLSGGLDSRSLASVMPRGAETKAYSYGYTPSSIETCIAAQIAQARGFSFSAHTIRKYLFDDLPEIVRVLHGSQDVTQARQFSVIDFIRQQAPAVLHGLWGGVWCNDLGLIEGLPTGESLTSYAIGKFKKRGSDWLLRNVAIPQLKEQDVNAYLHQCVADGLKRFNSIEDIDFRLKIYKTTHWAFRWGNASLRGFEIGAIPRIPYYDIDLATFFCTVPSTFVRTRRLQIDHLKRYAPDLARIHWQAGQASLYLAHYGHWIGLPQRVYRKLHHAISRERPVQRNWEVQFLSAEGRAGLHRWLLQPNLRLHEFISPRKLSDFVDSFYNHPQAANGYTISMLLTFSAWLEVIA